MDEQLKVIVTMAEAAGVTPQDPKGARCLIIRSTAHSHHDGDRPDPHSDKGGSITHRAQGPLPGRCVLMTRSYNKHKHRRM